MDMINKKHYLTVIIIAHNEGSVVGKTIDSLFDAVKEIRKRMNVRCDFLVNIDKGDKETIKYFESYVNGKDIKINYTNFGDPGLARNAAIRKAKGEYLALIDADDVVSHNWLKNGLERLRDASLRDVVHPETEIRFDRKKIKSCSIREEYTDYWRETLALIGGNRWCSVVMGRREVFKRCKYPSSKNGFGYEDYYFNCSVVKSGGRNLVARGTTAFCFQKDISVTTRTHADHKVLAFHRLFNIKDLQKKMKVFGFPEVKKINSSNIKIPETIKPEIECLARKYKDFKKYLIDDFAEVEIGVSGRDADLIVGENFCRLFSELNLRFLPKKIYFVDNCKLGQRKCYQEWVILMSQEAKVNPECGNTINFFKYFGPLSVEVQNEMIARLIVQVKPKKIIVGEFMIDWVKKHRTFLKMNKITVVFNKE